MRNNVSINFEWLRQIRSNSSLSPAALHVASALTDLFDKESNDCRVSIERIREKTNFNDRHVQKILKDLKDEGHIRIEPARGRGSYNRFSPILQCQKACGTCKSKPEEKVQDNAPFREEKTCAGSHPFGEKKGAVKCRKGCTEMSKRVHGNVEKGALSRTVHNTQPLSLTSNPTVHENDLEESIEKAHKESTVRRGTQLALIDSERARPVSRISSDREKLFQEFWIVYPSKDNEHGSRGEYFRQLDKGEDPAIILAGAVDYAKYIREEKKNQYMIVGKNWLAEKRWRDDWRGKIQSKSSTFGVAKEVMNIASHFANGGEI